MPPHLVPCASGGSTCGNTQSVSHDTQAPTYRSHSSGGNSVSTRSNGITLSTHLTSHNLLVPAAKACAAFCDSKAAPRRSAIGRSSNTEGPASGALGTTSAPSQRAIALGRKLRGKAQGLPQGGAAAAACADVNTGQQTRCSGGAAQVFPQQPVVCE